MESDRGERRRRDDVYVTWMKRLGIHLHSRLGGVPRWLCEGHLGRRKGRVQMHPHCAKKKHGAPKVGVGCKNAGKDNPHLRGDSHGNSGRRTWQSWRKACEGLMD